MKQINIYINEKLRLSAKHQYSCQPQNKNELQKIIRDRIKDEGPQCDLNDIDVSKITDMSDLFYSNAFEDFNGDISMWDVSNVENMLGMFCGCKNFNCDLSMWDVHNVKNMNMMFYKCDQFNCDISKWDVSNVRYMGHMFYKCKQFNCDLSKWNVQNVEYIGCMFSECENFNCDISQWDVSKVKDMRHAFKDCPTTPTWYDETL